MRKIQYSNFDQNESRNLRILYYQGDEIILPDSKTYKKSGSGQWHYKEVEDKGGNVQKLFIYQDCDESFSKGCTLRIFDKSGSILSEDTFTVDDAAYGRVHQSYLSDDLGFYVMFVTYNGYPSRTNTPCPGPDCDYGPFPDKMRIVRWQWNPPNDGKLKRPELIHRTPDPKARFTTEEEAEKERAIMKKLIETGGDPSQAPTKQMDDIVAKEQIRRATYKPTKVRQIALENIRKKKEAAQAAAKATEIEKTTPQKPEKQPSLVLFAGTGAFLLAAVFVLLVVIRRRKG